MEAVAISSILYSQINCQNDEEHLLLKKMRE
jgi:hypothetical protein